jgi:hypothetical protein
VKEANIFAAKSIIVHEQYVDAMTGGNDIALIRLSRPWEGPLMPVSKSTGLDSALRIAGFGGSFFKQQPKPYIRADGSKYWAMTDQLKHATVPAVKNEVCREAYRHSKAAVGPQQICAGLRWGAEDTCEGDSGGPLVLLVPSTHCPMQVGVVSWGIGCGEPNAYGVYSRVSAYEDWIRQKTNGEVTFVRTPEFSLTELQQSLLNQLDGLLDRASSRLSIGFTRSRAVFKSGDRTRLNIGAHVPGRLILIDIATNGDVEQIFPNKFSGHAHVIDGGTFTMLPDGRKGKYNFDFFSFEGRPGKGRIIGILVPMHFPYESLVANSELLAKGVREDGRILFKREEQPSYLINLVDQAERVIRTRAPTVQKSQVSDWGYRTLDYVILE